MPDSAIPKASTVPKASIIPKDDPNIRRYATNTQDTRQMFTVRGRVFSYGLDYITHFFWLCHQWRTNLNKSRRSLHFYPFHGHATMQNEGMRIGSPWSPFIMAAPPCKTKISGLRLSWPRHHAKRRYENRITVVSVFHGRTTMQNEGMRIGESLWSPSLTL